MVLTARWKDNLHELPRSTGCTSAALNMIKLYCLIQKKPVFFKLIWNESPIQAFIPPMCFPGFLNHHKFRTNQKHLVIIRPFGSPKEPWLTSLETVASSCGKKDHGCLWCFSVPPKKEVQKKGSKLKPPKKGYTPLTSGQKFLEPWCFASVFFWGMKPLQQRQLLTPNQTPVQSSQKKWDLCISLSPWKVFRFFFLTLLISSSTLRIPQWTNYTCADVQYEGRNASWRAIRTCSHNIQFSLSERLINICHHPLFNMTNGYPLTPKQRDVYNP